MKTLWHGPLHRLSGAVSPRTQSIAPATPGKRSNWYVRVIERSLGERAQTCAVVESFALVRRFHPCPPCAMPVQTDLTSECEPCVGKGYCLSSDAHWTTRPVDRVGDGIPVHLKLIRFERSLRDNPASTRGQKFRQRIKKAGPCPQEPARFKRRALSRVCRGCFLNGLLDFLECTHLDLANTLTADAELTR